MLCVHDRRSIGKNLNAIGEVFLIGTLAIVLPGDIVLSPDFKWENIPIFS